MDKKENSQKEIDLGELFALIGKAFLAFFRFIGRIIREILILIISFLLFIRKFASVFLAAIILGIIIGWFIDISKEKVYRSSMIVEPNFNSVQQLYNNIEFYNELAREKEFEALSEALKISKKQAQSIEKIIIESFSDQTQKIRQFSEFIQELDTVSRKLVTYDDYLENFNDINAKFHKITIESTSSVVAKKCQPAIVKSIENNDYFKLQKMVNDQNLAIEDTIIMKQLIEIDSLQNLYKKLRIIEANRSNTASTNINLSEKKSEITTEIDLLKESRLLKKSQIGLNTLRANTKNTINVISDFPRKGVLINDWITKWKLILPLILVIITFITLSFLNLNNFLKKHTLKNGQKI